MMYIDPFWNNLILYDSLVHYLGVSVYHLKFKQINIRAEYSGQKHARAEYEEQATILPHYKILVYVAQ